MTPLPCPWCGEVPDVVEWVEGEWVLECPHGQEREHPLVVLGPMPKNELLKAWNTRA